MWTGAVKRYVVFSAALLALCLNAGAAASNEWKVVSPPGDKKGLDLPKTATVTQQDASGRTWQQQGEIRGSFTSARGDFQNTLQRQGWRIEQTIPTGVTGMQAELLQWTRGKEKLLILITEEQPGRCSFALGTYPAGPAR